MELRDVYVGPEGVLTGSARLTKKAENEAALLLRDQEVERRRIDRESKRTTLEAQITLLRAEFTEYELASLKIIDQEKAEKAQLAQGRVVVAGQSPKSIRAIPNIKRDLRGKPAWPLRSRGD